MKRTDVTYGQLDGVLRSLGFTCRVVQLNGDALYYEHAQTGAQIILPPFPKEDRVLDYHLIMVRVTLDGFGVADPAEFEAKLRKAG